MKYVWLILLLVTCSCTRIFGVTLVYNMRVRRTFTIPESLRQSKSRWLLTALPIYFSRDSTIDARNNAEPDEDIKICEDRKTGGTLLDMRYIPSKHWWLSATTGIEKDSGTFTGDENFSASRVGFDDIVVTGGYRHFSGQHLQLIGYGLVGLPTRREVKLTDRFGPLVGTRIYNAGLGAEISYSFVNTLKRSSAFIAQGRFIHGFDRSWFPILPRNQTLIPGNFSDLLFAFRYREKRTVFQGGYDLTVFNNQGIKGPIKTVTIDTFTRNSWYATIGHGILSGFFDKPTLFGAGLSISNSKRFDAKTFTAWIFLSQLF